MDKHHDDVRTETSAWAKLNTHPLWNALGWLLLVVFGYIIANMMLFMVASPNAVGRELAKRAICSTNMDNIGKAIIAYHGMHKGLAPPDLVALARNKGPTNIFVCPSTETPESPKLAPASLDGHCDYIYISGTNADTSENLPMVYELPVNHSQRWSNLLFADYSCAGDIQDSFVKHVQLSNDYLAQKRRYKP